MVSGPECWAVWKEEGKFYTTEMRMLRWARGETRLDHVRNVDIWKEAHMYPMAEFLREKRLRWFGHVQRRDEDEATRNVLHNMTVDGTWTRGRPKLRWGDLVKDDMARNQMTTEMGRPGERRYGQKPDDDWDGETWWKTIWPETRWQLRWGDLVKEDMARNQTTTEMVRPGERGYGQKPDDNWDGETWWKRIWPETRWQLRWGDLVKDDMARNQMTTEMVRPGERGYGQKPDDNWDGETWWKRIWPETRWRLRWGDLVKEDMARNQMTTEMGRPGERGYGQKPDDNWDGETWWKRIWPETRWQLRWGDLVKEDMARNQMTTEMGRPGERGYGQKPDDDWDGETWWKRIWPETRWQLRWGDLVKDDTARNQMTTEMGRPGERGYGQKPDDNWDGETWWKTIWPETRWRLRWGDLVKEDMARNQMTTEMGRPGERRYGQKPDDDWDGETWWKRIWQETRWQLRWWELVKEDTARNQMTTEMGRPGERRYGQKPDDDWDGETWWKTIRPETRWRLRWGDLVKEDMARNQMTTEMGRPGERGYGQKPDDDWDGETWWKIVWPETRWQLRWGDLVKEDTARNQMTTEMVRPGERGYGQKPDDNWDGETWWKRIRPETRRQLRWGDLVKEDMARNQMTTEMVRPGERGYGKKPDDNWDGETWWKRIWPETRWRLRWGDLVKDDMARNQTTTEMGRPGERRYGQKPDDDWDGETWWKRIRPETRWRLRWGDLVKEDMARNQMTTEMVRPGERGYGQKPDDDWDGETWWKRIWPETRWRLRWWDLVKEDMARNHVRRQKTLACHKSSLGAYFFFIVFN